jgi:hypothetical protein
VTGPRARDPQPGDPDYGEHLAKRIERCLLVTHGTAFIADRPQPRTIEVARAVVAMPEVRALLDQAARPAGRDGDEYAEALRWFRENPFSLAEVVTSLNDPSATTLRHAATIARAALAGARPAPACTEPLDDEVVGELATASQYSDDPWLADRDRMQVVLDVLHERGMVIHRRGTRGNCSRPGSCPMHYNCGRCDSPSADEAASPFVDDITGTTVDVTTVRRRRWDAEQAGGEQT